MVIKQIRSWQIPANVVHLPTNLTPGAMLRLAIDFDGHGYCLLAHEIDGDYTYRQWHPSLKAAEQKATELFGPSVKQWETTGLE